MAIERRRDRSLIRPAALTKLLQHLSRDKFVEFMSVLDREGIPLTFPDPGRKDILDEFAILARAFSVLRSSLHEQSRFPLLTDITVGSERDGKIFCRYFEHHGQDLYLFAAHDSDTLPEDFIEEAIRGARRILTGAEVLEDQHTATGRA